VNTAAQLQRQLHVQLRPPCVCLTCVERVQHKYSDSFTYNYVLPMCAAIWSVSNKQERKIYLHRNFLFTQEMIIYIAICNLNSNPETLNPKLLIPQCFDFNIQVLVRFWANHHLLGTLVYKCVSNVYLMCT
jgi:hypothetical protein